MSNKPKEFNTTELTLDYIKQNDAGFDQDRYLPQMNYVSQYKGVQSEPPRNKVIGDMYYDDGLQGNTIGMYVWSSFRYQGALLPAWAPATTYDKGDYVDNGGVAYIAAETHTSGGAFELSKRVQVAIVNTWLKT